MKPFYLKDAVAACGGRYVGDEAALAREVSFVTSDSRTAAPGALFVAFRGERVDGHDFMADCLAKGAAACVSGVNEFRSELPVNTLGFFCTGEGYADISAFTRRTFGTMFYFR